MEKYLYDGCKKEIELGNGLIIPKISDMELLQLYKKIKPIVTLDSRKYLLKNFSLEELRRFSYIYNINRNIRENIDAFKLESIDTFLCLHSWVYYGLFKPTIGEVLSQIPRELVDDVNSFEIINMPTSIRDIKLYEQVFNKGYHLSRVRTYKLHK